MKVKTRDLTRATNRLHNLLARTFPELATTMPNVSAGWVLSLLKKYPTAEKIARAQTPTLTRIPYATQEKIQAVQQAAFQSVGSFRGAEAEASPAAAPQTDTSKEVNSNEKAAGRKQDISSQRSAVTAATDSVESDPSAVNSTNPKRPFVDFAHIRSQVSMRQILEHLDVMPSLRPSGGE